MTMQNARTPGRIKKNSVLSVVKKPLKKWEAKRSCQLSIARLTTASVNPIGGASQKTVAAGLSKPILWSFNRRWVKLHRKPPNALADNTSRNPPKTKCDSVATIKITPEKMRKMTPIRRLEKTSNLKRKAKARTNMRDEDLTIAMTN
jgi:hypothetical protein